MNLRRVLWLQFVVFAILAPCCAQSIANSPLSADESKLQFRLFPEPSIQLPLTNSAIHAIPGKLFVEMLGDAVNNVVASNAIEFNASPGTHIVALMWDKDKLPGKNIGLLGGYRLRYTITPNHAGDFQPIQSIVQLGPHIVDGFVVQGFPYGEFPCALDCKFIVRVSEPNSGRALEGYIVNATFFRPDGPIVVKVVTDRNGYSLIRYVVSNEFIRRTSGEWRFDLRAVDGDYFNGWGGELFQRIPPQMVLFTDRQDYQPGGIMHAQLKLIGVDRLPWKNGNVTVRITDLNNDKELFSERLVTSNSGEAHVGWSIPASAKKGQLSIWAESKDEPQGNWTAQDKVIVRVVPPVHRSLSIEALSARAYYAPGEDAEILVTGRALSGKPLSGSIVRLQVLPMYPRVEVNGQLDDAGRFVVHIPAQVLWKPFQSEAYRVYPVPRSWNLPVEVSVTDKLTGQSESTQTVLRLAPQPVHLQVYADAQRGSDRKLGIISSYADGSPAAVEGVAEAVLADTDRHCTRRTDFANLTKLGKFRTNRYGVGQITLPQDWIEYAYPKREDGPYSSYSKISHPDAPNATAPRFACISLRATDRAGKSGTLNKEIVILPETKFATRISTDHCLYHPGDPLRVWVESEDGLEEAVVEIRTADLELATFQHIRLVHGIGRIDFPYSSKFSGLLVVRVYAVRGRGEQVPFESWGIEVIYPNGKELTPGERWPTDAWTPDRVQPDHPRGFIMESSDDDRGIIAGMRKAALLALEPSKPFPAGLDLIARFLLGTAQEWGGWPEGYLSFRHQEFDNANLAMVTTAVEKVCREKGHPPKDADALREWLQQAGIDLASLHDAWGMSYRFTTHGDGLYVISNGPDKTPRTTDDYLAEEIRWPSALLH